MKLKKGDQVKIVRGKDRTKTGTILRVIPEENRVVVDGLNVYRKRIRPTKSNQKGQVVEVPRSLAASNVMFICKSCKAATRVGYRTEGNEKVRYCKKCQAAN
jgi:large subunit ribosomal protein L24